MHRLTPLAAAALVASLPLHAQTTATSAPTEMPTVNVSASADASAQGLSPAYAGGQVARGGRAGVLGTRDNMDTPFSITSYTNELIQDRQARSVGDVLQNEPTVRVAKWAFPPTSRGASAPTAAPASGSTRPTAAATPPSMTRTPSSACSPWAWTGAAATCASRPTSAGRTTSSSAPAPT